VARSLGAALNACVMPWKALGQTPRGVLEATEIGWLAYG